MSLENGINKELYDIIELWITILSTVAYRESQQCIGSSLFLS